jgi:microcystin-dependent protein
MEQKRGRKFLSVLNSKPVIGALIFIFLSLITVFAGNVVVKEGSLNVSDRIYDKTGFVTPVASINAYGGNTAPVGWLLCDGANYSRAAYADLFTVIGITYGNNSANDFKVPDLRGIFARGAGTSGKLSMANGTNFSAILGTYQNDSLQGHRHSSRAYDAWAASGTVRATVRVTAAPDITLPAGYVTDPTTDGTNGVPRTGAETSPANVGVNYIIKY